MQVVRLKLKRAVDRAIVNSALLKANVEYALNRFRPAGSAQGRLGEPVLSIDNDQANPNICIFVIYAEDQSISTLSYIDAVANAGFRIIVINNAKTSDELLGALSKRCWRIYNRINLGRDIGAYKDGILMLLEEGHLKQCASLCLANDSTHFIPGTHGEAFTKAIIEFINSKDIALFSHASHQISRHYQSYFQIVKSEVINSDEFMRFWKEYRPLSHRKHCIHNGEIALSARVYNHIKNARVLYTFERCLRSICEENQQNRPSIDQILGMMPSPTKTKQGKKQNYALDQLLLAASRNEMLSEINQHYLMDLLESSNPTQTGAFLFPAYISCPLVKHDLCFSGAFSIAKALHLFRLALASSGLGEADVNAQLDDFRHTISSKGIPAEYMNKPFQRALKGVSYEYIYTLK